MLWKVLEQYDVKRQLLDNIRAIYADSKSAVRTPSGLSKWFPVTCGVRQGCVLSSLLFIIYMDRITKEANPNPEALNELLFADDQAILSSDKEELQHHTDQLNRCCEEYGMRISVGKTEVMTVGRTQEQLDIKVSGTQLKQATDFKYLGSVFSEDGKLDREIETRCQKANAVSYQLAPLLRHPSIPMCIKAQLISTVFVPTLTYQCQTWSLTKALERKLVTCEMRCLSQKSCKQDQEGQDPQRGHPRDCWYHSSHTTCGTAADQMVRTPRPDAPQPASPSRLHCTLLWHQGQREATPTLE